MSTLEIALFVILCPCLSYIIIRRKMIPWTGGVMLVKDDGSFIPIDFEEFKHHIGRNTIIKGIFLPGAHMYSLPSVVVFSPEPDLYHHYIEKDGGVYVLYNKSLSWYFDLNISSANPWKGQGEKKWDGYSKMVEIKFDDLSF